MELRRRYRRLLGRLGLGDARTHCTANADRTRCVFVYPLCVPSDDDGCFAVVAVVVTQTSSRLASQGFRPLDAEVDFSTSVGIIIIYICVCVVWQTTDGATATLSPGTQKASDGRESISSCVMACDFSEVVADAQQYNTVSFIRTHAADTVIFEIESSNL